MLTPHKYLIGCFQWPMIAVSFEYFVVWMRLIAVPYFPLLYNYIDVHPVRILVRIVPHHPVACRKRWLNGVPLRIWVRIDPPHPLCVVRGDWMERFFEWDRKTETPCHSRCGTIKIPPCLKALSAVHWRNLILQPFTGNDHSVSFFIGNYSVRRF
jgi:hypothetical protein